MPDSLFSVTLVKQNYSCRVSSCTLCTSFILIQDLLTAFFASEIPTSMENFYLNLISKVDTKKISDNALCILSFHQLLLTICAYCFSQNFLDLLQNIILCHFISDFYIVCVPFIFSWWLKNIKDISQSLDSFLSLLTMSSLKLDFKKCIIFL